MTSTARRNTSLLIGVHLAWEPEKISRWNDRLMVDSRSNHASNQIKTARGFHLDEYGTGHPVKCGPAARKTGTGRAAIVASGGRAEAALPARGATGSVVSWQPVRLEERDATRRGPSACPACLSALGPEATRTARVRRPKQE